MNKKISIVTVVVLLIAAYFGLDLNTQDQQSQKNISVEQSAQVQQRDQSPSSGQTFQDGLTSIRQAYDRQQSDLQVQALGQVKAILADDNQGSRHQKFILNLDNGLTVLVAHNIDLAPRIENLRKGDTVEFYGEYEYSEKGGVIHWTHHDPQNRHVGGWLKHSGKIYQ